MANKKQERNYFFLEGMGCGICLVAGGVLALGGQQEAEGLGKILCSMEPWEWIVNGRCGVTVALDGIPRAGKSWLL